MGEQFTDGTAVLMCVPPIIVGSLISLSVECVISTVSAGLVQPVAFVIARTSASVVVSVATSLGYDATSGTIPATTETAQSGGLVLVTPTVAVGATFDLANTTASAGPQIVVRLDLCGTGSAIATVDWGRATVRVA